VTDFNIASLVLSIDANTDNASSINFSPCHKKFIQPVTFSQAEIISPAHEQHLSLSLRNGSVSTLNGTQVYQSASWGLKKNEYSQYIFTSNDAIPSLSAIIDNDFSHGLIIGEFTQPSGITLFSLGSIDIRIFSVWLATLGDVILHASGIALDGKGYCFTGESGAGKSTLAAALSADPGVTVLGEDQVILRYLDGQFWIFGTPWHTDPKMCSPLGVPLEKMYFLDRSLSPGVRGLKPASGVANLLQTAFVPYYMHDYLPGILERLSLLARQVPFYSLSYQLGSDPGLLLK
jgi:hypothetical protein